MRERERERLEEEEGTKKHEYLTMEMEWVRGATLGRGSFSTVNLALFENQRVMAVKSTPCSKSSLLHRERSILDDLQRCPRIVRCFGDCITAEQGGINMLYNLFLEYVPGGTLYDLLRRSGGSLAEPAVRCYTRSLLQGLRHIHAKGYVHCDIKLQNIMVCSDNEVKIADFGLAKKAGHEVNEEAARCLHGTPLYMAPESVARGDYEALTDIWSLGCAVAEMATGRPAWRCPEGADVWTLLLRIGFGDEMPEIPAELSHEGKDFLSKCFVRNPEKRWTAEMLLNHPFVASQMEDMAEVDTKDPVLPPFFLDTKCEDVHASPRSIFNFSPSPSVGSSLTIKLSAPDSAVPILIDRVRCLTTGLQPEWSCCALDDGWITVRTSEC